MKFKKKIPNKNYFYINVCTKSVEKINISSYSYTLSYKINQMLGAGNF